MQGSDQTKGAPAADSRFFPVPVDALDAQVLEMDLYLKYDGSEPTLYRGRGLEFSRDDVSRLAERGVRFVHIPAAQHGAYRTSLTRRLTAAFKDPDQAAIERGRVVRASCSKIIEEVLLFPGKAEPVETVAEVARTFSKWSREDPAAFSYLLDMSNHDFGTATHMINVGVGCGLLARELDAADEALFQTVVQGGMLHDVGKRGIPEALLNKEGKLDPAEWKLVSAHPMRGFEELRRHPDVSPAVLSMVRDHHEHMSGAGYPQGLKDHQISPHARFCAVIDVFDAITAARPYRGPTPPADTLKIMADGRGKQFDAKIFDTFKGIVDNLLDADPLRAPAAGTGGKARNLAELLQNSGRIGGVDATLIASRPRNVESTARSNRRRFDRFNCNLGAAACFLHQGKATGVKPGQQFMLRLVDIGRGGLKVLTPWPLSLNDILSVEIQPKEGTTVTRLARVVSVRKHPDGWAAGLAFVEGDEQAKVA